MDLALDEMLIQLYESGTSEGVQRAWAKRHRENRKKSYRLSLDSLKFRVKHGDPFSKRYSSNSRSPEDHAELADIHGDLAKRHLDVAREFKNQGKDEDDDFSSRESTFYAAGYHRAQGLSHKALSKKHREASQKGENSPLNSELVDED